MFFIMQIISFLMANNEKAAAAVVFQPRNAPSFVKLKYNTMHFGLLCSIESSREIF